MRITLKRSAAVVAAGTLVLGVSGVAYAFWTQGGSGTGTATTADTVDVTVNQTSTVSDLAPGVPSQALSGTFTNPNDAEVRISGLTAVVTTDQSGCGAADYAVTGLTITDGTLPADSTSGAWNGSIQFVNDPDRNQNACKGATVTIAYALAAAAPAA